jgi:hypothetical protein
MPTNWMQTLSAQYENVRRQFPRDPLMLLSDIDGTILDMRHMILAVLRTYDYEKGTRYFERLRLSDIKVHENEVDRLIDETVPEGARQDILRWYLDHRWEPGAIREMHRPFRGVLEVIRWFQLQPNTHVGLVTGRPEAIRTDTLRSLNELGKPYRVQFSDELLYMNPADWEQRVPEVKVAGLRYFREKGYRVFAFIDNEPVNLKAVGTADNKKEVLLLHAHTIFESKRTRTPRGTVWGEDLQPNRPDPR